MFPSSRWSLLHEFLLAVLAVSFSKLCVFFIELTFSFSPKLQMQLDLGVSVPAWRTITDHVGPALLEGLDTFFETIRVMAAASAPGYLRAAMVNTDDKEHATRALRLIITKGTKQLPRERSMEALLTLSEALEQCLKLAYTSSLPDFDGENDLGTRECSILFPFSFGLHNY